MAKQRCAVLTGAGISTDSGIPDYRGGGTAQRARSPMRFQEFAGHIEDRRRYWARATLGWQKIRDARPNEGHRALTSLREAGYLSGLMTQNVDGLHEKAGFKDAVELHGALHQVICLDCGLLSDRDELHQELLDVNPNWLDNNAAFAP
ncbi:MAG: NAD-dependent deacetylase, partial [Polyangiaceae bacterium]|nr:NAD-dependent deacetylase [Polyangiaceae bacterium]